MIEQRLGPVDILVANAGGSTVGPGPLEQLTEAEWRESLDTNLTATFLTIKAFLPGMKQRGHATIITMSSAAARRPTAQSPVAYAAAKAGIELLTKHLAIQAGPHGVRVNCIAPESILTERNQQQIPEDVQEQLRLSHPIQRLGMQLSVTASPPGPVTTERLPERLAKALRKARSTNATAAAQSASIQARIVRNLVNSARSN
jgi:3-oxoacyl-[acyl-carrier protein] reductase